MRKRLLASLMSLCLVAGLTPATALAAEDGGTDAEPPAACTCTALCVEGAVDGNCPVCAADSTLCAYTAFVAPAEEIMATAPVPLATGESDKRANQGVQELYVGNTALVSGGAPTESHVENVSYDAQSNTLFLNGVTVTEGHVYAEGATAGVYASGDLTIVLTGTNTIGNDSYLLSHGISIAGNLTIDGSGSLTVYGDSNGIVANGDSYSLTIASGQINAYGGKAGLRGGNNLIIEGGEITAQGGIKKEGTFGILANKGTLKILGGNVNAINQNTSSGYGMKGAAGVEIYGGTVTASGTTYDIYTTEQIYVFDGVVSADNCSPSCVYMSGICGAEGNESSVTWKLEQNNQDNDNPTYALAISGSGAMADFERVKGKEQGDTPWYRTGMQDRITEIVIEDGITAIGENAFRGCSSVAFVCKLPDTLTSIGAASFCKCTKMSGELVLPTNLVSLGGKAFMDCPVEGEIVIPDTVTSIGNKAFSNTSITGVAFEEGAGIAETEVFSGCKMLEYASIPQSVTEIPERTFANCEMLKTVVLHDGVTVIGKTAFYNCKSLTGDLVLPADISTVGDAAFFGTGYQSVVIPCETLAVGTQAFDALTRGSIIYCKNEAVRNALEVGAGNDNTEIYSHKDTALAVVNGGFFGTDAQFEAGKLAAPTKEGLVFASWYDNADFTGTAVTAPEAGKTYYAKWVTEVNFDANGGEGSMAAQQVAEDDATTQLSANAFSKAGYTFAEWNTASDGSGTAYAADAVASTVPHGTTLYAQWTPNTYTIQFNGGMGASGATDSITATYDTAVKLPANGFKMTGKKFAGWSTNPSADDGAIEFSDETEVLNLAQSGTVTLYAVWTDKQVLDPDLADTVVTYNGQPQKFSVDDGYTVKYYQNRTEVADPVNAGIYDVEIYRAEDDTYAAYHGRVMGGLVIDAAPLTIKADDKFIYVGATLPDYTYTATGLIGGDVLTTEPVLTCADADANKEGAYTITVSGADAGANYAISYEDGTLTVAKRSSGGSDDIVTETVTNPDGSVTTVVTNKKTGTVTKTTTFEDGSTLVVETKKDGTVTTTETAKNGVEVRTVNEPGKNVTAEVTIPESVDEATVTVPADVDYGMVAVDAKTGEVVKLSVPTEDGMLVKLSGSAELVLEDRSRDFADIGGHWAEDAVDFASAHELFFGVGESTFAPDDSMTRAMLMTVLARFDGQDTDGGSVWYEKAVAWAVESGVSNGADPDEAITREQLATMLWRYAGNPEGDASAVGQFTDGGMVSDYAVDAMNWAVDAGLFTGMGDGTLAPQDSATRAQVATVLMRFVVNLTE